MILKYNNKDQRFHINGSRVPFLHLPDASANCGYLKDGLYRYWADHSPDYHKLGIRIGQAYYLPLDHFMTFIKNDPRTLKAQTGDFLRWLDGKPWEQHQQQAKQMELPVIKPATHITHIEDTVSWEGFQVFTHPDFCTVRGKQIDGDPWLRLRDVCNVLCITNGETVNRALESDGVAYTHVKSSNGIMKVCLIDEVNTINLLGLAYNTPARRWIVGTILPALRKQAAPSTPGTLAEALELAASLERQREQAEHRARELSRQVQERQQTDDTLSMNEAAKLLNIPGIGQNKLFSLLVAAGALYKKGEEYLPYQQFVNSGVFTVKEQRYEVHGVRHLTTQVRVTPSNGMQYLRKLMGVAAQRLIQEVA